MWVTLGNRHTVEPGKSPWPVVSLRVPDALDVVTNASPNIRDNGWAGTEVTPPATIR
jgi:hypothetical protein